MLIHKITPSEYYNLWLKRLDTHFNPLKVPKVVKPTNKLL